VILLTDQGRTQAAITLLRTCVANGTQYAGRPLANILAREGKIDEAIAVLRTDESGDKTERLVNLLADEGRVDELRHLADAGDRYASRRLAALLACKDQTDAAIAILRRLADIGDVLAAEQLALLLMDRGQVDEAILTLRAHAGVRHSVTVKLSGLGWTDAAIEILQARAETGDTSSEHALIDLLVDTGREDELRRRLESGVVYAALRLADMLVRCGRVDDAIAIMRPHADSGDMAFVIKLTTLLAKHGYENELRHLADTGDFYTSAYAYHKLAYMLADKGREGDAIAVLRSRIDAGDARAINMLLIMLERLGRNQEADNIYRCGLLSNEADTNLNPK
jgi:tetratricopeptide (TPR) repeat protein